MSLGLCWEQIDGQWDAGWGAAALTPAVGLAAGAVDAGLLRCPTALLGEAGALQPASPGCCLPSVAETWQGPAAGTSELGLLCRAPVCRALCSSSGGYSPAEVSKGVQWWELGLVGPCKPLPWALPFSWGWWCQAKGPAGICDVPGAFCCSCCFARGCFAL